MRRAGVHYPGVTVTATRCTCTPARRGRGVDRHQVKVSSSTAWHSPSVGAPPPARRWGVASGSHGRLASLPVRVLRHGASSGSTPLFGVLSSPSGVGAPSSGKVFGCPAWLGVIIRRSGVTLPAWCSRPASGGISSGTVPVPSRRRCLACLSPSGVRAPSSSGSASGCRPQLDARGRPVCHGTAPGSVA